MILDLHIYTVEVPPDPEAPISGIETGRERVKVQATAVAVGDIIVVNGASMTVRSVMHKAAGFGYGDVPFTSVHVERRVVNEERRKRIEEAAKAPERGRR